MPLKSNVFDQKMNTVATSPEKICRGIVAIILVAVIPALVSHPLSAAATSNPGRAELSPPPFVKDREESEKLAAVYYFWGSILEKYDFNLQAERYFSRSAGLYETLTL